MASEDLFHLAAEQAVLGAVITDNGLFQGVAEILGVQDFAEPAHRVLWEVIADWAQAGRAITGAGLKAHFQALGRLEEIGGAVALARMIDDAAFGPEARAYAEMIADMAGRRRLVELGEKLVAQGRIPADAKGRRKPLAAILDSALTEMQATHATLAPDRTEPAVTLTTRAMTAAMKPDTRAGLETGLEPLDRKTGGLFPGELVVLGGRPSMGKSALCDQIELNVARRGGAVLKFSLEMNETQLGYRTAARWTHMITGDAIPYASLRNPRAMKQKDVDALSGQLHRLPKGLRWDTTPGIDLGHVRAAMTRMRQRQGRLDLVTIDYLQLMDLHRDRQETEAQALGRMTRGLRQLAKEFGCAMLVLSQLSRQVEARSDKRPQLSDLRESGAIEQDADMVWLVYREHYYLSREAEPAQAQEREKRLAELAETEPRLDVIVAKQRMGGIADVRLWWCAETSFIAGSRADLSPDPSLRFEDALA